MLDADGELVIAVADMAATAALTPADLDDVADAISDAALVVLDGNLAAPTLGRALDICALRRCAGRPRPGQRAQGRGTRR